MSEEGAINRGKPAGQLRRGWTTGACATAATRAAYEALITGCVPDPVEIALPRGQRVAFAVATSHIGDDSATVGIVKDAGDDPDVTHGALIKATIRRGLPGSGVVFRAGSGVGMVTKPGLPIPPDEPAINPVPREMMRLAVAEVVAAFGASPDVCIEISVPGGEALAQKTMNARLGILGGISILGTTGIVIPYSCAAWIHSIHYGIDVARATGVRHIAGATGSTSEKAVKDLYGLPEGALIDMGDFVGGLLKHVRAHPVPRITIAGGFAKMTKLGQGLLDLHSRSGSVDLAWLAQQLEQEHAPADLVGLARSANTALEVLQEAERRGVPVGEIVARSAWTTAAAVLDGTGIALEVVVFDRQGRLIGRWN